MLNDGKIFKYNNSKLKRYGLSCSHIKKVDLRLCYVQSRPNNPLNNIFGTDFSMSNSPHMKFAHMLYNRGDKFLKSKYKKTHYYKMVRSFGKKGIFPNGFVKLCKSIKKNGYLSKGFNKDYIIVLNVPFSASRYNRKIDKALVPEIWSGHHRVGILLALGLYCVDVIFAKDECEGICFCYGGIHKECKI